MQQTGMAKADEEVCDFVGASAGLGKLPVYNTAEDLDQTLEVLNAHSVPELQTGLFLGVGLVSPIYATVDISMRTIRRAGKSVLRKKILKREKMASDAAYNYNYLYGREPNETCEDREVFAHREAVGDKSSAVMPKTSDRLLERVMRPVSFSQAESK
ncbi:hypothetical protein yc1106_07738 [Curvularia clavata]|uniref:Uncharacterized protein n=1 Tax=Curvularia clavata TaxID=95742 RepID=A0A9Q8ZFF7_CURCL|nr:hypothetical protein yc1106_07738 [Curvularia clavata]